MLIGNPNCTLCKLHQTADEVCEIGFGSKKARVMVVSRMPNSETYQNNIVTELKLAGLDVKDVYFTSVLKCRTFDQDARKREIKACTPYLEQEIDLVKPEWILGFGNEPLQALAGHSGIMKYRGKVIDKGHYKYIGTMSPASVTRNPGQLQSWRSDLIFFVSQVQGKALVDLDRPPVAVVNTKEKLVALRGLLETADLLAYDLETSGFDEFTEHGGIVCMAGTMVHTINNGEVVSLFVVPLFHPASPFRNNWQSVLKYLRTALCKPRKLVAHNGKFDARWLRHYGVPIKVTFDTMLAAHLLDENRLKGLKPLARMLLGVPAWDIDTKDLLSKPLKPTLLYCALDTFYTYHLYRRFRQDLIEAPRLMRLFVNLTTKANNDLIDIERRGVWCDREKLASAYKIAFDTRDAIEEKLMAYVPDQNQPGSSIYAESFAPWPVNSKGKPVDVNFNPSKFARWWLFEHLGFPVYEYGKDRDDGQLGDPSMAEATMLELRKDCKDYPAYDVITLLMERSKWQKYCSTYVSSYQEIIDDNDRIHTTFKLAGTVTGRLSSGKADEEKISSRRDRGRGVNLQQVPRDPFIRGLFGAPPGWTFVESDFSQIELRIAAFIAGERTMLKYYQQGVDLHRRVAARVIGCPESRVTNEQRKLLGKKVNFGYVYGMYPKKFVKTAWENDGLVFSIEEATAFRKIYFDEFPRLLSWHARQKRIAHHFGRVQSPMGRVRRLPDIYSEDKFVVMEAERQAINSPVQAMASDMNTFSMVLIGEKLRREGLDDRAHVLGVVHDAINFEVRNDVLHLVLPLIKRTMENLPLKTAFGVDLNVPIVADLKLGSHWGGAEELTEAQVYNFQIEDFAGIASRVI